MANETTREFYCVVCFRIVDVIRVPPDVCEQCGTGHSYIQRDPEKPVRAFTLTTNDKRFLASLRIAADE